GHAGVRKPPGRHDARAGLRNGARLGHGCGRCCSSVRTGAAFLQKGNRRGLPGTARITTARQEEMAARGRVLHRPPRPRSKSGRRGSWGRQRQETEKTAEGMSRRRQCRRLSGRLSIVEGRSPATWCVKKAAVSISEEIQSPTEPENSIHGKRHDERSRRMKSAIKTLNRRPAWKALTTHYKEMSNWHLRDLFADDAQRGERLTAEAVGLYLDYSKNRIT